MPENKKQKRKEKEQDFWMDLMFVIFLVVVIGTLIVHLLTK